MERRFEVMNRSTKGLRTEINTRPDVVGSRAGNWFGRKYDPYYTLIVAIIFWWVTIFTAIIALYFK